MRCSMYQWLPTSHLQLLLRPGKGLCLGGAHAPAQPPHCPAWIFYIYFSLPSFAVAVVNLPFSKFNKKLIEKKKKKRERKVISTPTIKGQLTSQFSSGQEKKSGIRREKLNSPNLSPWGVPALPSQGCCVPYHSLNSSWVLFSQLRGKQEFILHYWWLRLSRCEGLGSALPAGCHSPAPSAPLLPGRRLLSLLPKHLPFTHSQRKTAETKPGGCGTRTDLIPIKASATRTRALKAAGGQERLRGKGPGKGVWHCGAVDPYFNWSLLPGS